MNIIKNILYSLTAFVLFSCGQVTNLQLPEIISDGMVIQQNSHMTFWGKAIPGSYVSLKTDWDYSNTTTAQQDSMWSISFPTIKADNVPHQITVSTADTTIVVSDILLGEVWLASGQGNMSMPLSGWGVDSVEMGAAEIARSNDPLLRMFNVDRHVSWRPNIDVHGQWLASRPENSRFFSAAAYFFAKALRDSLDVPVGIVNSSFSLSPCEAWISDTKLLESVDYGHKVANLSMLADEMDSYVEWLRSLPRIKLPNMADNEGRLAAVSVNDEFITVGSLNYDDWGDMELPRYWDDTELGDFDGVVWFANRITIPQRWVGHDLTLYLGPVDDCDMTYVNGVCVGGHSHSGDYSVPRIYKIPGKYITDNVVLVSVRVTDTGGNGGFPGCEGGMRLQYSAKDAVSIEGVWKYRPAAEIFDDRLVLFDPVGNVFSNRPRPSQFLSYSSPSSLYYGMLYPIRNYTVSGVIWSQGEGNVGRATQFEEIFPLFIESIREAFGNRKLPVLVSQIPAWHYNNCDTSTVANLREAQRRVVGNIRQCFMFSSADIGDNVTIHPAAKYQVGMRFARLALYHVYDHRDIVPSGPVLVDASQKGQFFSLTFDNANGLYVDESLPNQFEVAGEDGVFFPATAVVQDNVLNLFSHAVGFPKYARYVYRNCAQATLFNGEGLPAETFMIVDKLED